MDALVKVKNLTKSFGSNKVLENLNFEIADGESFGILGPAGSGKTTLINTLAGILKPTEGTVSISGNDLYAMSGAKGRKLISLVPQTLALYPDFNAHDNLKFFGSFNNIKKSRLNEIM